MDIRRATEADWPALWGIMEPIVREGETLCLPRDGGEDIARDYFASAGKTNFVAIDEAGTILGASYVQPNRIGPGAHIANCGYITSPLSRGKGVARALCAHSIEECRSRGFRGIQFNFVVSTNEPAVHLWQSHGFETLARLPGAFNHPRFGYVDALVMFRSLV